MKTDRVGVGARTFCTLAVGMTLGSALLAGCGDGSGAIDAGPPDMAMRVVNLSGKRSGLGDACTPDVTPGGDCTYVDAICYPDGKLGFPGGYCAADCSRKACPSDAECVQLPTGESLCLALCNTDKDCRDGYVCSDYKACIPQLGFYLGSAVRPGTKGDGTACDPTPQTFSPAFAANYPPPTKNPEDRLPPISALNGSQTTLSVDSTGDNIVIAWMNLYGAPTILVASSQDGGMSFGPPTPLPSDNTIDNNTRQSDPVAAVDSTGTFFVAWTGSGNDPDNVYLARSTDSGVSFPDVFVVSPPGESSADTLSKPSIAVGPDDTIYVAWTTSITGSRVVRIVSSADGGVTWTAPVSVNSDDTVDHENARIAVSSDLSVYATWVEVNGEPNGDAANQIAIQRLTPALIKMGMPLVVSGTTDSPVLDVPSIAVDGKKVYVAYTSGNPEGRWDIMLAQSNNSGVSALAPVKLNKDASCATHFHPTLAIDDSGSVHAAYYDNRNLDGAVRHQVLGLSEEVVNDTPFPFTTEVGGYDWLGDYLGMVTVGANVYLGWADTRTNDTAQIQFTRSSF